MKSYKWNASEYPAIEEDSAACPNAALEDGDTSVTAVHIGDIARIVCGPALKGETGIIRGGLTWLFRQRGILLLTWSRKS